MLATRWLRVSVALACTLGILAITWLPAPPSPPMFAGVDKVVHVGSFFVVALAWRWAGLPALWVATLGTGLAAVTEYGQGLLPWPRSPELADLVADVAGVALALATWWIGTRARQRATPPSS